MRALDKEKTIELLQPYLILGYSINKACEMASIPHSTVATWLAENTSEADDIRLKIGAWQGQVSAQARKNVVERIYGFKGAPEIPEQKTANGVIPSMPAQMPLPPDLELSRWWLERKDKEEFKASSDIDENSIVLVAQLLQKMYADRTRNNKDASSEAVQK